MVYNELGRLPLYIRRKIRIVKFWCKLLESENCIYQDMFERAENYPCVIYNWPLNVKKMCYFHWDLVKFGIVKMLQTKNCSQIFLNKDYKTVFSKIVMHFFFNIIKICFVQIFNKQVMSTVLFIKTNFSQVYSVIYKIRIEYAFINDRDGRIYSVT